MIMSLLELAAYGSCSESDDDDNKNDAEITQTIDIGYESAKAEIAQSNLSGSEKQWISTQGNSSELMEVETIDTEHANRRDITHKTKGNGTVISSVSRGLIDNLPALLETDQNHPTVIKLRDYFDAKQHDAFDLTKVGANLHLT